MKSLKTASLDDVFNTGRKINIRASLTSFTVVMEVG
jgi:hypothetical protein